MNLHRTTGHPDWEDISPQSRTQWQRLAVATRGVVTLGNLTTLVGLGLVIGGLVLMLAHSYWLAGILIAVGRLLDLADGWLADATQTKSPLGELMDAGADKVETFAALIVMYMATLAPWWLLTLLLAPHVGITLVSLVARVRGFELHPSRLGKVSMAMLWAALFGLLALRVFGWPGVVTGIVYGAVVVTVLMTAGALVGYGRQLTAK